MGGASRDSTGFGALEEGLISSTTFTLDESDELAIINTGLGTYCQENFANFVTGAKDIDDDATYEQFLKDFENYNLSRITEIRQDCYNRYLAR